MKPPWAKHSQDEYKRLAKNPKVPQVLRVVMLAMGHHKANRHAEFKRGELSTLLSTNGKQYRRVDVAIKKAVQYGLLDASSTRRCLVVPPDLTEGPVGDDTAYCPTHGNGAIQKFATKCLHADRKNHAKGLCNPCYQHELRLWNAAVKAAEIRRYDVLRAV